MTPARDRSLDVFRGATVALMILVNNPGSWSHLYGPLAHAPWHGWTLTDLVFPFFLLAVGNALALTAPTITSAARRDFIARWLRRTLLIFAIGLLLNAWPLLQWSTEGALQPKDWDTLRIMGVLQRIALCWAIAALIVRSGGATCGLHNALLASAVLLLGYWAACVALAQGPDPYALETWFGTAIDRAVFGPEHLYQGEGVPFDPEGLASTLPAIAQVLAGYAIGVLLLQDRDEASRLRGLLIIAVVLVAAGWVWSMSMPINKKIWTSSYVLLTTGLAAAALAALRVAITGLRGVRPPLEPLWRGCEAFGRNALLIFALSGMVPRTLGLLRIEDGSDASGATRSIALLPWLHRELFEPMASDPRMASLLYALAMLAFYWLIARALQRRGWFFRA